MDKDGANAFIYAKASGDLGKSFIGERANRLFEAKNLVDLWSLLFPSEPVPMVPEFILSKNIEEKAFNRFMSKYISFIDAYDKPEDFLIEQIKVFEVENLKTIVHALSSGENKLPGLFDLGKHNSLHLEAWPDLEKITAGTDYAWLKTVPSIHELQQMEYKLDIQIVQGIWHGCKELKGDEGKAIYNFIQEEYSIQNAVWALRLKLNFDMTDEEIEKHLIYVSEKPGPQDPVCSQAFNVLNKDPENISDWENWKYKDFINPKTDVIWEISPSWIEKKYKSLQGKKASVLFHSFPVTDGALFGWFKLKQYELAVIRMSVERLRLNVNLSFENTMLES